MQAEKDALKISVTGRESSGAKLFQIRFGMPSGPTDLKAFISAVFCTPHLILSPAVHIELADRLVSCFCPTVD